jgi:enoyl-CoA hydratase/carnithine racemase
MGHERGRVTRSDPLPGVALLRIEHDARLGALPPAMCEELGAAWKQIAQEPATRAVVLTGSGRGFSTGLDVIAAAEGGDPANQYGENTELPTFGLSPLDFDVWLPYVVAVNGVCAGGGFHLLTDADIVVAAEDATFLDPHVSIGQVSALEPIALLRRMPLETVMRMTVLGKHGRIDASGAARAGLVGEVVSADNLVERAIELAALAAQGSPAAIAVSKKAIRQSMQVGLDAGLRLGWQALRSHWEHPDYREGLAAYAERRAPNWTVT